MPLLLEKVYYKYPDKSVKCFTRSAVFDSKLDLLEAKEEAVECLYVYACGTVELTVKNQHGNYVLADATDKTLTLFTLTAGA